MLFNFSIIVLAFSLANVQGLAIPTSSTAGVASTPLVGNEEPTPASSRESLVPDSFAEILAIYGKPERNSKRDIPAPVMNLLKTVEKLVKRDELVQRDIPAPVMNLLKTVEKLVKRDELVQRDIPAPVMNLLKTVEKLVKRDELVQRDIPAPVMNLLKTVEKLVKRDNLATRDFSFDVEDLLRMIEEASNSSI